MTRSPTERWRRIPLSLVPSAAGVATIATGAIVLLAWVLGWDGVKRILPGLPQMKANTAIALMLLGAALLLLAEDRPSRWQAGHAIGWFIAGFGVFVLIEYLVGPLGVDEVLFDDPGPTPGRPAPHTAVVFVLLGLALATLDRSVGDRRPSDWLLAGAVVVVISALVGYVYAVDFLRATSGTTGMAINTLLALAAVTAGTACLRPERGLIGYLRHDDGGATAARHLLPAVIIVPLLFGSARLLSEDYLGLEPAVGVGLSTLATMGVYLVLVLDVSAELSATDRERARAEAASEDALTRFRMLLEATPDPMVVVDHAGRIEHVNVQAARTFGYDRDEVIGSPVERLLPERFHGAHAMHRMAFSDHPTARPMGTGRELFARRKDGSELQVEISLNPVDSRGGRLVIASIRDVTERKQVEARLREAAHFFDMSHDLLCTASNDGWFQQLNGAWEQTLGWTAEELRSRPLVEFVHPDDVRPTARELEKLGSGRATAEFVNRYRTKSGDWRWLEWNATPSAGEGLIYASARDITARVRADEARLEAEERFTQAFEEAPIGMALTGPDGRFLRVNTALCVLTGYSAVQLEALDTQAITHPEDLELEMAERQRTLAGESNRYRVEKRYLRSDGELIPVELSVTLIRDADGRPSHFISHVVDMSERKHFEGQLQYLADHDPLTGLFNRRRFADELTRELAVAARYAAGGALLALDLDHFKYVNDSLGHSAGDELIRRVGAAMKDRLRDTDVLARLGGDEFAVVLPRVSQDQAMLVAEDVLTAIRQEGQIEGGRRITASIGVAMFDDAARVTADELLVEADIAMYDAKETGRDKVAVFNVAEGRQERMHARVTWADRIHHALDNEGFVLHAQPILGIDGDRAPRYELLIRMLGENGDLIFPSAFLAIAERFDMIKEIDRWVVRQAIDLLAEQQRAGRDVRFEVNLSAKSVIDPELPDVIARHLASSGVAGRGLCFEITETAAIINVDRARSFARRLQALGCTFALDDFGSGFASFYYLKHLEFDYLKIDGEFIRDLTESHTNQLVVQSLVRIAKGLGKHTIAECVGDDATLRLLERYGVDYAQGFYIARPAPLGIDRSGGPAVLPDLVRGP